MKLNRNGGRSPQESLFSSAGTTDEPATRSSKKDRSPSVQLGYRFLSDPKDQKGSASANEEGGESHEPSGKEGKQMKKLRCRNVGQKRLHRSRGKEGSHKSPPH